MSVSPEYPWSETTTVNISVRICVFPPYFCSFGLCCLSFLLPLDFLLYLWLTWVHLGFILYYFSPLYINSAISFFYVLYSFLQVYFFLPATLNCQFVPILFMSSRACLHFISFLLMYCMLISPVPVWNLILSSHTQSLLLELYSTLFFSQVILNSITLSVLLPPCPSEDVNASIVQTQCDIHLSHYLDVKTFHHTKSFIF